MASKKSSPTVMTVTRVVRETFTLKVKGDDIHDVVRKALDKASVERRHPEMAVIDKLSVKVETSNNPEIHSWRGTVFSDTDEH